MRNAFLYPLTSRAREVSYKSPPAPLESFTGRIQCSHRMSTGLINQADPLDTEAAAILRVYPLPFSGWATYYRPDNGGCCTARMAGRNEGVYAFQFNEVRFEIIIEGKLPNSEYRTVVHFFRRADASDNLWEYYQSLELSDVADAVGTVRFIGFVPNAPWFETYVSWAGSGPGSCSDGTSGSGWN